MKTSSGFTLVELIVVIAIIGLLASVIVGSLNDAREGALDAKIKTEMVSLGKRAAVEESSSFTYDIVCGSNGVTQSTRIVEIITAIESNSTGPVVCNSDTFAFAASVPLETDYWCIDSEGSAGVVATSLSTTSPTFSCP